LTCLIGPTLLCPHHRQSWYPGQYCYRSRHPVTS
jgi:hypothetical protein